MIDVHVHLGKSVGGAVGDGEMILHWMDEIGISISVVFPIDTVDREPTYEQPNQRVFELYQKYPDRIIPFCRVQPKTGKQALDEIERCRKLGFKGLKLHPETENFYEKDVPDVLNLTKEIGWPVLIHTAHHDTRHPNHWYDVFKRYPSINFILGHAGKDNFDDAGSLAKSLNNVFLDTSTISYNRTRHLLEKAGAQKMLFASDFPYSHPLVEKTKFDLLITNERDKKAIFEDNAKRIFNLD